MMAQYAWPSASVTLSRRRIRCRTRMMPRMTQNKEPPSSTSSSRFGRMRVQWWSSTGFLVLRLSACLTRRSCSWMSCVTSLTPTQSLIRLTVISREIVMPGLRAGGRQMSLKRFPEEAAMSRLLAIFLIGVLAAGCTPGRIDRVRVESGYDPVQYRFVPYNRAMKADVSGNPFGMDQQAFNTLVSETIQPPGVVPSDGSPYRVQLAFNGSTSVNRDLACRASGGGVRSGDMTLVAA